MGNYLRTDSYRITWDIVYLEGHRGGVEETEEFILISLM